MSDPALLPKDPVTLDDLKRAIEAVPLHPGPCIPGQNVDIWLALLHEYKRWALEAWRTAFEWRETFPNLSCERERYGEYLEGVRLIQEKLQS